jgi:hypothetical protein
MYTVLIKGTGERCYYPNTRMLMLPMVNLSRTTLRGESLNFTVDAGATGLAVREALTVRTARAGPGWGRPGPGGVWAVARLPFRAAKPHPCWPNSVQKSLGRFYEENCSELSSSPVVNFVTLEVTAALPEHATPAIAPDACCPAPGTRCPQLARKQGAREMRPWASPLRSFSAPRPPNWQDPLKVRISVYWQCSFGANEDRRARIVKNAVISEVQSCLARLLPLSFTIERRPARPVVWGGVVSARASDGTGGGPDSEEPGPSGATWNGQQLGQEHPPQEQGQGQQEQQQRLQLSVAGAANLGRAAGGGALGTAPQALGGIGSSWLPGAPQLPQGPARPRGPPRAQPVTMLPLGFKI